MADDDSRGAPTSHDVARLAGVSRSAVSRAFTEGASLSAAKRERILEVAATLGYRPNVLARSLNKGRSRVVGVVFGQFQNPFFGEALDAFASELARHGLRMLFFAARTNATVDEQVAELLTQQVSAVVLMAVNLSSQLAERCERARIPVVLFNRTTSDAARFFSVTGDNAGGATAVAEHLVARSRRRLAFVAGYAGSSRAGSARRRSSTQPAGWA